PSLDLSLDPNYNFSLVSPNGNGNADPNANTVFDILDSVIIFYRSVGYGSADSPVRAEATKHEEILAVLMKRIHLCSAPCTSAAVDSEVCQSGKEWECTAVVGGAG
ncbi:hypothetical protein LTR66_014939, partial [Elasticomyces elasticus]